MVFVEEKSDLILVSYVRNIKLTKLIDPRLTMASMLLNEVM